MSDQVLTITFYFALGPEETPGVPAPPEKMQVLGQSEFGSAFFVPERLHNRHNFKIMEQRLNWRPQSLISALTLISASITNILGFLKWINGVDTSEIRFSCPTDESYFEEPWKLTASITSMGFNSMIRDDYITPLRPEEILSIYNQQENETNKDTEITQE